MTINIESKRKFDGSGELYIILNEVPTLLIKYGKKWNLKSDNIVFDGKDIESIKENTGITETTERLYRRIQINTKENITDLHFMANQVQVGPVTVKLDPYPNSTGKKVFEKVIKLEGFTKYKSNIEEEKS